MLVVVLPLPPLGIKRKRNEDISLLLQTVLCAVSEIVTMRFVEGIGQRTGLMGIDYPTARWLYKYVTNTFL